MCPNLLAFLHAEDSIGAVIRCDRRRMFCSPWIDGKKPPRKEWKNCGWRVLWVFFLSTNMRNDLSNEETSDSSANGMNIFSVPFLQEDVSYVPNGSKFFAHQNGWQIKHMGLSENKVSPIQIDYHRLIKVFVWGYPNHCLRNPSITSTYIYRYIPSYPTIFPYCTFIPVCSHDIPIIHDPSVVSPCTTIFSLPL